MKITFFDSVDHFFRFDCDVNAKKPIYTYVNLILYSVCNCQLTKKERRCDVYRTMVGSWLLFLYLLSDGSSLSLKPEPRPFKNF